MRGTSLIAYLLLSIFSYRYNLILRATAFVNSTDIVVDTQFFKLCGRPFALLGVRQGPGATCEAMGDAEQAWRMHVQAKNQLVKSTPAEEHRAQRIPMQAWKARRNNRRTSLLMTIVLFRTFCGIMSSNRRNVHSVVYFALVGIPLKPQNPKIVLNVPGMFIFVCYPPADG